MTHETYIEKRFQAKSLEIIDAANVIIDDLQSQGFTLTLRQLYYQFVSRSWLPNRQASYNRLGTIVSDARLAGLISWDALEDRTRFLRGVGHHISPSSTIANAAANYRLDKWEGAPVRVEVWIEKDALVGVIERVCTEHDVDYFSCRGYVSQSVLWNAGNRLTEYLDAEAEVVIIHLGDHDPSGIDMTRDIQARLDLFTYGPVQVERIALNMSQIEEYKPPPNPAKLTDTRARDYISRHGGSSWELDALEPSVIENLIETQILKYRDPEIWERNVGREKEHRALLSKFAEDAAGAA